jgi:hypothetical protein
MASTYSALKIELLETGANSGTWGTATNVNLGDAILGEAITGQATVDFNSDADVTITLTDSSTSQAARNLRLNITESSSGIGSVRNLILGSGCQIEKFYLINNTGTGAKTVKNTSGTGISVPAGKATLVFNNGTNVVDAASYFTSLTLGSALPVTSGGTGSTSTTFVNLASNVTGTLPVANGGTGTATPALVQGSNITITGTWPNQTIAAAAPGTGTVTSVGGTGTVNGISLSGSVTTSGSLTLGGTLSGVNLASQVTGTLPIANGGTGTTSTTFANLTTNVTGTLPIANGGTNGTATPTANGVVYGTGSTIAYTAAGTTGQVLTATTSGAPTWVAPSSGALVYISQVVASNSATVSFTGLTVYDNYMIIWSKAFPTATSTILFTMLTSIDNGSNYATSSYKYSVIYGSGGNTSVGGRSSSENSTYINLTGDNMNASVASSQISGQIVLNLKNGTSYDFFAWGNFAETNDNPQFIGGTLSSNRAETSATNAVRFKFTSGNIASGTFRLYGIVNS